MKPLDELKYLAENDPDQFEKYRDELINSFINSVPEEHQLKLKQIQWKLDGIHKTKKGLAATIEISKMMWESFYKLKTKLEHLQ